MSMWQFIAGLVVGVIGGTVLVAFCKAAKE